LNKAIVAEITTTIRGIPQEVPVGEPEGLVPSVANLDNIHVVAKRLLSSRVGVLAGTREQEVKRARGYTLDWAELKAP
jgi:mRNA-degrading endonuclease toxin of MazEF toxin-antitoxin module